jgi:hypothetical protein
MCVRLFPSIFRISCAEEELQTTILKPDKREMNLRRREMGGGRESMRSNPYVAPLAYQFDFFCLLNVDE